MRILQRSDEGSASVQLAIILPIFMALLMLIVQFALYFHAEHITAAAAAQAVATAGVEGGTSDDGRAEAERILHDTAAGFLQDPAIHVERDGRSATVRISGRVMAVVPFLHLTASSVARVPVETLTGAK
jgi:hypothetical protein